ncbi:hypothetical protein DSO57_1023627 [Entomophthora muscae]|uniref:Uncharacterized protein n=1 Tax=Entomophthora muscae TaxID=34485 RepID=A0ACC2UP96_9FUNG|nr:hypothetical protein DSO57_1023627 [Entomophthora muscae]
MSEQAAEESEISRLLKVYSRSMQEDILSRVPSDSLLSVPTPITKTLTAEHVTSENSNETTTLLKNDLFEYATPTYLKASCLFIVILIEFGYHYSENTFSTLKSTIKENFQIDNFQYGIFQSSSSLVASILPFLGGVLLENFGIQHGCLLATSFLALSSILIASSFMLKEFYLLVLGNSHLWFRHKLFCSTEATYTWRMV